MGHDEDRKETLNDASGETMSAMEATSPVAESAAETPNRWRAFWLEWVKPLVVIALVMFSFRSAVADWNDVPTGSMKPTILEGDRIFINKVAYDLKFPFTTYRLLEWGDPLRGEVVVLRSPEDNKRLVKRVVGLPGDLIEVRRKYLRDEDMVVSVLYINREPVDYDLPDPDVVRQVDDIEQRSYVFATETVGDHAHPIMNAPTRHRRPFGPFRVPDGHYFVMGDNRDRSRDSREFGAVPRSAILGRATAVALSVDRDAFFAPRWERFFSRLP